MNNPHDIVDEIEAQGARSRATAVAINAAWNLRLALAIIAAAMIGAGLYILPIIPAASLLFAGLADMKPGKNWRVASWVTGLGSVVALVAFVLVR